MKEVDNFLKKQREFSCEKFGEEYPLASVLKHLRKETLEIEEKPSDLEEWADAFLLLMDGLWRSGFTFSQLFSAAKAKLEKNKKRSWKKGSDGVIVHVDED